MTQLSGNFTDAGWSLMGKLLAGSTLKITKVVAGAGTTALNAAAMADPKQTLSVRSARCKGATATLPVTLAAALADNDYILTELGVYARDPDKGEILFQIFRPEDRITVRKGSSLVTRFNLDMSLSGAPDITVICSPAGLVIEEEFAPVEQKVFGAAVAGQDVSLQASELQEFLDALPRFLDKNYKIFVQDGSTADTQILLNGFHGSGRIEIRSGASTVNLNGGIKCVNCTVPLRFTGIKIAHNGISAGNLLEFERCRCVTLDTITLIGSDSVSCTGVYSYASRVIFEASTSLSISHCKYAVWSACGSTVAIASGVENGFHDNTYGAAVYIGGMVILAYSTPTLLGGAANWKAGGLIVKTDGTLL